jgi:hypothetical protein
MSEETIEKEIQDKGLTAPRLTPDLIDSLITSKHFFNAYDAAGRPGATNKNFDGLMTLTFCVLVLKNGTTVTGESNCVSKENFDAEIGQKIAFDNARNEIWSREGYLLKERLYQDSLTDTV